MKNITELLELLESDLNQYNSLVEEDILKLLQNKGAYFLFEYDYEWLEISAWATNKEGVCISQRIDIPSQKKEKYFPSDIFMDKDIHLEDELYDQEVEEDEIDDYLDE